MSGSLVVEELGPGNRGSHMRIVIIGVGHVGLVTAACLAEWGHDVVGVDADESRIELLLHGTLPFHEPGLDELVARGRAAGRLTFVADVGRALEGAAAAFVCVGTPSLPGGGADLRYVESVTRQVARLATDELVLIEKSTVPAQTGAKMAAVIEQERVRQGGGPRVLVASNPEFLQEGSALADTLHPDRIVIGANDTEALATLRRIYERPAADGVPLIETDVPTAELIKHASNAFLATKISFVNAVARICEAVDADVEMVADGMGLDPRIGPEFLRAGLGFGGSCFPKDLEAFAHLARQVGYDFRLLEEVLRINEEPLQRVMDLLWDELWHLEGKTVALLGAAFKPGTDDLREAPALKLGERLLAEGAQVRIYDPVALDEAAAALPKASVHPDPVEACEGAYAAIVCTEWPQIAALRPGQLIEALHHPVLIDARNVFAPDEMAAQGLHYHALGRGASR